MTKDLKKEEKIFATPSESFEQGYELGKQAQYEKDTELMNAMFLRGKEKQKQAELKWLNHQRDGIIAELNEAKKHNTNNARQSEIMLIMFLTQINKREASLKEQEKK